MLHARHASKDGFPDLCLISMKLHVQQFYMNMYTDTQRLPSERELIPTRLNTKVW